MTKQSIIVPEHILDLVVERTQDYTITSRNRWLDGLLPDEQQNTLKNSTHNKILSPERRELHRAILQEVAANITGDKTEKPTMIYLCGPMAVGKTKLRNYFAQESTELPEQHQRLAAIFKEVHTRLMVSDFSLYKARLPEFSENNNNFTLIRPEASGLDQAVNAWAKELGVHVVLEQLGDGVPLEWFSKTKESHNLVAVGVTASPRTNLMHLNLRNQQRNENISDKELLNTIKGFSAESGFDRVANNAQQAFLISADSYVNGFQIIQVSEEGKAIQEDRRQVAQFRRYANLDSFPS